jgi:hypothetical protein
LPDRREPGCPVGVDGTLHDGRVTRTAEPPGSRLHDRRQIPAPLLHFLSSLDYLCVAAVEHGTPQLFVLGPHLRYSASHVGDGLPRRRPGSVAGGGGWLLGSLLLEHEGDDKH